MLSCEEIEIHEVESQDIVMVNIKIVFNEGLKQEWIVSKSAKQLDEFMTALEKNPKIDFLQFGQKLPNK